MNTSKCADEGDTHRDVIVCVSYKTTSIIQFLRNPICANVIRLTPANLQISVPVATSVSKTSSATQVKSFVPSGVTATGPDV